MFAIRSLESNQLCGVGQYGGGEFTLDAINVICDALTKSRYQLVSTILSDISFAALLGCRAAWDCRGSCRTGFVGLSDAFPDMDERGNAE
eukprot:7389055-Prymnesium_polylepis.1